MILFQVIARLLAFIGKELTDVLRRPGALASLVLGPFLILAVFGYGYRGLGDPLRAIVVVPPESGLPTDLPTYQRVSEGLTIGEIDANRETAELKLSQHQTDVVVVVPPDAQDRFEAGEQELPYDPFIYLKAVNEGIPVVIGAARSVAAERFVRLSGTAFGGNSAGPTHAPEAQRSGGLFRRRR